MAKYRLRIKRLDYVSPVDTPAQETARVLLTKKAGGVTFSAFAPVVKLSESIGDEDEPIGLVFCWAVTEKAAGQDYFDLQGDQVMADDDLIRAALDYVKRGAATDEMHDGDADGFAPFVMPLTADVAKAFGIDAKTTGLMVGLKPSPDVFAKFKSGEYTGVSIEGVGERTKVASMQTKCEKCGSFAKDDAKTCPGCGAAMPEQKRAPTSKSWRDASGGFVETDDSIVCVAIGKRAPLTNDIDTRPNVLKATWSTADVDDFPDSSFLYIEGGGSKDSDGKTTPRSLRHFPYKDENGKIDLPHLRDAIGRIPQSSLPATLRNKLQVKAEKLLAAQHAEGKRAPGVRKAVLATTATAGHAHLLSDNGETDGYTDGATMPGADDGGWHQHPWLKSSDNTIVILEAEGHAHEVMAPADIDSIVESPRENDVDEDDQPQKRNRKSTHSSGARSVGLAKENIMATEHDQKIAELTKRAERAEKIASLTDAQRAYHARLSPTESETFLAKSASDRDAVAKAAIVYTAKDGTLHFDVREAQLAKRIDDQDATIAKRDAELADERLAKRADAEIPHLGDADVRKSLLRAIDGIADEKVRSAALKALKGGSEAMSRLFKATDHRLRDGFELPENGNGAGPDDPALALRKRVEKYQTDHKIASYEQALIKATATDPEARRLYELARN